MTSSVRLCVLSDTHGHLPREVVGFCKGADHIFHAGDMGSDSILPELEGLAPVTCVLGNVDAPGSAPIRSKTIMGGCRILVQHIVWERGGPSAELQALLGEDDVDLVIFGHTHRPLCRMVDETVFFNPGSCGPRRFNLPRTVGEVILDSSGGWFRIFETDGVSKAPPMMESWFGLPFLSNPSNEC